MTGSITPQQLEFLKILSKTGFLTNKHLEQVDFAKLKKFQSLPNQKAFGRWLHWAVNGIKWFWFWA